MFKGYTQANIDQFDLIFERKGNFNAHLVSCQQDFTPCDNVMLSGYKTLPSGLNISQIKNLKKKMDEGEEVSLEKGLKININRQQLVRDTITPTFIRRG